MGEISVSLKRGTVGAAVSPIARKFENTDKVHEKTLKGRAISQMARFVSNQYNSMPFADSIKSRSSSGYHRTQILGLR